MNIHSATLPSSGVEGRRLKVSAFAYCKVLIANMQARKAAATGRNEMAFFHSSSSTSMCLLTAIHDDMTCARAQMMALAGVDGDLVDNEYDGGACGIAITANAAVALPDTHAHPSCRRFIARLVVRHEQLGGQGAGTTAVDFAKSLETVVRKSACVVKETTTQHTDEHGAFVPQEKGAHRRPLAHAGGSANR